MTSQAKLIIAIQQLLPKETNIGIVLADVLKISSDAAYRRARGETAFSIFETETLCRHFNLSMDDLFSLQKEHVSFLYQPTDASGFSVEGYLENVLASLERLKDLKEVKLIVTVNNTPFFQLFQVPNLLRFKLYFWAKMHLKIESFQQIAYNDFQFSNKSNLLIQKILKTYNSIPSIEIVDPELMRGLIREVNYYYQAQELGSVSNVFQLFDDFLKLINHFNSQAKHGSKFRIDSEPSNDDSSFEIYFNETLNAITSFYYSNDDVCGLLFAHNYMNFLHTTDPNYVSDSKRILDNILLNSRKISVENKKERNHFFAQIEKSVKQYKLKIEMELEE
jgi:hypothetical protein